MIAPNPSLDKAVRLYSTWMKYWPKDKKGALESAYQLLSTPKDKEYLDKLIKLKESE